MANDIRVAQLKDGRKAIIIRTSDRATFKQCRRKWGWSSHLKHNLGPKYLASPLWFGSAIHYALEDYHGYNRFGTPSRAFQAFCIATAKQCARDLPDDAQELYGLGIKMMDYYVNYWLRFRKRSITYWAPPVPTGDAEFDAGGDAFREGWIPQCEVNFEIPIPLDEHPVLRAYAEAHGADCILYRGTIDRVSIDPEGRLWIVEYKTAKRAEHLHYQTDAQVTTYCWAATYIYGRPVAGVLYYQFVKNAPEPPRTLANGKLSLASNLVTSYPLYYEAMEKYYGTADAAPAEYKRKLAEIGMQETENKDRFIVRERVNRNEHMCHAEAIKILLETEDMLNPNLPLYPNPTRDCPRMCSFLGACVSMDDGGDWGYELEQEFSERDQEPDRMWRKRLPEPDVLLRMIEGGHEPNLIQTQRNLMSMDDKRRADIEAGEGSMELPTFTF